MVPGLRTSLAIGILLMATLLGCPPPEAPPDAGRSFRSDAGEPAPHDAGAGGVDSGTTTDGGQATDSGTLLDAGHRDAGGDGGPTDAGGCGPATATVVPGDLVLVSDDEVAALAESPCVRVEGDLTLEGSGVVSLQLPGLVSVGGTVTIVGNTSLTTALLPALIGAGGVVVTDNPALLDLDLGALVDVACEAGEADCSGGDLVIARNGMESLDLSSLSSVGGSLDVSEEEELTSLDMGALGETGGDLSLGDNPSLSSVDLGALADVGGTLRIVRNTTLPTVDLSSVGSLGGSLILAGNRLATVDLSGLAVVGEDVVVSDEDWLFSLELLSLSLVRRSIRLTSNDVLSLARFDALASLGSTVLVSGSPILSAVTAQVLDDDAAALEVELSPYVDSLLCRGGACVAVPAGALAGPTVLRVDEVPAGVAPPPARIFAGPAYAFLPHGALFGRQVRLSLPYEGDPFGVEVMKRDDDFDVTWALEPTLVDPEQATVVASSFSLYAASRECADTGDGGVPSGCEPCNGIDDDADGVVDEGCVISCDGDAGPCPSGQECDPSGLCRCTHEPEVCNGEDDDCDGIVDEDCASACGTPADCPSPSDDCVGGTCRCVPQLEDCDGVDDDCDGLVDDGCPDPCIGVTCAVGELCFEGACCDSGAAEICNGVDDDCDGLVDEELGTVSCGTGACEEMVNSCQNGTAGVCTPGVPDVESCNGVDDDCDGLVDDDLGTTTCGTGACERTVASCFDGGPATCTPGSPSVESCNGVDDDCDGIVDDGCPTCGDAVCDAVESCANCTLDCGPCTCVGDTDCTSPQTCVSGTCA